MPWDEVVAALFGGLEGGAQGWQVGRRNQSDARDREERRARQAIADAAAAEDRKWQLEERERLGRERLRTGAEGLLSDLGPDAVLSPEQAARVGGAGLDHRMRPEETLTTSFFATGDDGEIARTAAPGRPTGRMRVAPTPVERERDTAKQAASARLARTRAAIEATGDEAALQAFDASPESFKPTRDSFLSPFTKQREAQDAAQAAIDAKVKEATALQPLQLEEHEGKAKIDARYRPPSARERGPTDYQTFGMIDKLNARFNSNTKATREVARQYQVMQSSWQALEKGTAGKGTAEQGIVSTFNKILDPDSVVREGEYDRTAQGQALLQRMQTIKDNLKSGGKISRDVLKDMVDLAGTYATRADAFTKAEKKRVGSIANRMGIDQSLIFTAEPAEDAAPSAGEGTAPAARKVGDKKTFPNGNVGVWDGKNWVKQ